MIKLLFKEGGQPVYLDDLENLQSNAQNQLGLLLSNLGDGADTYLFDSMEADIVSDDITKGTTTFKTRQTWLAKGGVIYEIPPTTLTVKSWNDPIWLGIKKAESDKRTFDDGQERTCMETAEVYLSADKTSDDMVNVNQLKTLWQLVAPEIQRNERSSEYQTLKVTWYNGYSGVVQGKDIGDAYRIKIDVSSSNTSWEEDAPGKILMAFDDSAYMIQQNENLFVDVVKGTGGDTPARQMHATLAIREGIVYLEGMGETDVYTPQFDAIKVIFEIPK